MQNKTFLQSKLRKARKHGWKGMIMHLRRFAKLTALQRERGRRVQEEILFEIKQEKQIEFARKSSDG